MTGPSYTHRDLAKAVGVTVTTIKSYRRKFPAFLPVESQGKPLRLAGEALAVCKRIHHHFHRGLSVVETRKRLAAEFPALAQAVREPLSPPPTGPGFKPGAGHGTGQGTGHDPEHIPAHVAQAGQAFLPVSHGQGSKEPVPGSGRNEAGGPPPTETFPRQPEPLARIEALMGDLFSLQNRTHSLMAELVSKLDTLTGQLAASLPGASMAHMTQPRPGTQGRTQPAVSGPTGRDPAGTADARGQHRAGMSAAPGEPWGAPSGTGVSTRQAGLQPGSGVSTGLAANGAKTFGTATPQGDAPSFGRSAPGSAAPSGRAGPARAAATAGTAPESPAPAGGPLAHSFPGGAARIEAGRPQMPAGSLNALGNAHDNVHGTAHYNARGNAPRTAPAELLSTGLPPSMAAPDASDPASTPSGSVARPGADFLGLTVVVQSERGEFLGVTGKNGRPFDLAQFEGYLLRRAEGPGSFTAAWHRQGPDWVLELLGQGQVHAHHFHKATTPKGNTVALFASLTVGGKAVSETSLQSFLRQVKESLGD